MLATLKKIFGKFLCFIGDHDWTGAALEGQAPTPEIIELAKRDPLAGFRKFSKMYCRRCGKESNLTI